jgi:hypothetical protein
MQKAVPYGNELPHLLQTGPGTPRRAAQVGQNCTPSGTITPQL